MSHKVEDNSVFNSINEPMDSQVANHCPSLGALRLSSSPELGRYLVAGRAMKAGDVAMKEFPLAVAPGPLAEHVCFCCHHIFAKAHLCKFCRIPLCGTNCQMSAEHQKECHYLRKIAHHLNDNKKLNNKHGHLNVPLKLSLIMLPMRLLFLRDEQPEKWKLLMNLESHLELRKSTANWGFIERNIVPHLQVMMADRMPNLSSHLVQQICGAIDVNSFEIRIDSASRRRLDMPELHLNSREVLRGTFYQASLMAHSCIVNAQISIGSDTQMIVRATVPIREGEGVFVSYTDPLQTTLQRRNFLAKGKYFTCRCRRCQDPTEFGTFASGFRCPSCPNGLILPQDVPSVSNDNEGDRNGSTPPSTPHPENRIALQWQCPDCGKSVSQEEMIRTEEVIQNIIKNVQRLPVDRHLMDRCEELFLTLPKKLHTNHALLMQLRIYLIHLYGNVPGYLMTELPADLLQRKAQLCTEMLDVLLHICPGYSRLRGIVLYEFHAPLVVLASKKFENGVSDQHRLIKELQEAESYLKEAVGILIHEPVGSPESRIAKAAMADLKQLRDYIRDMEHLKLMNIF